MKDYRARVVGQPNAFADGETATEALVKLVLCFPNTLGLQLEGREIAELRRHAAEEQHLNVDF